MTQEKGSSPAAADFHALNLSPALLEVVQELGYTQMTPIQAQTIPPLLAGRDLIGAAKTGSGKTVAFALPILERIRLEGRQTQALILCPTRELCAQVAREFRKLGRRHPGLQVLILAGGQPSRPQIHALEKGAHIAVGTPGRVLDHLRRGSLNTRRLRCIVLDEADRMLDMGFQEDMEQIFAQLPKVRQTVLFSATYPQAIEAMSRSLQHEPLRVTVSSDADDSPTIRQQLYEVAPGQKLQTLQTLLKQHQPDSALIFCNHKATTSELAQTLLEQGLSADALNGDLEQAERDRVLAKFRNQSVRVLVATDVAARGLDVAGLELVCNFDLPAKPETYVHRIGRTGRAGKKGLAISFVGRNDAAKIAAIEDLTGLTIERPKLSVSQHMTPAKEARLAEREAPPAAMVTLYISGGRKAKVRPGDILGALTGEAGGLTAGTVGKIEIHDHFAYVAVAKQVAETALNSLRLGKIKGRKFQVEFVR